jgi:type IV fimbrial biogenesis protein FimT
MEFAVYNHSYHLTTQSEQLNVRNNKGFSFYELMTVVAIMAILAAIAIPNLIGWLSSSHLRNASTAVKSAIDFARLQAVRQNADGQIVFNPDDTYTVTVDGQVLRNGELPGNVDFDNVTFAGSALQFNGQGIPSESGSVDVDSGVGSRRVTVSLAGSTSITNPP